MQGLLHDGRAPGRTVSICFSWDPATAAVPPHTGGKPAIRGSGRRGKATKSLAVDEAPLVITGADIPGHEVLKKLRGKNKRKEAAVMAESTEVEGFELRPSAENEASSGAPLWSGVPSRVSICWMDAPKSLRVALLAPAGTCFSVPADIAENGSRVGGDGLGGPAGINSPDVWPPFALLDVIAPLLAAPSVPKILHGSKSLRTRASTLSHHGLAIGDDGQPHSGGSFLDGVVMDTMVAAHLLGGEANEMDQSDLAHNLGYISVEDLRPMMDQAAAMVTAGSSSSLPGGISLTSNLLSGSGFKGPAVGSLGSTDVLAASGCGDADEEECILQSSQLWMMGKGLLSDLENNNAWKLFQVRLLRRHHRSDKLKASAAIHGTTRTSITSFNLLGPRLKHAPYLLYSDYKGSFFEWMMRGVSL